MVTSIQAKVQASRLKDSSYQRALANRSKAGESSTSGMGLDSTIIPTVDDALKLSMTTTPNIQKTLLSKGEKQMTQAGQPVNNMYSQIDETFFSGLLPGGASVDTDKLKVAGTGVAVGAGLVGVGALAYAGYKYFTKDGKPRKTKADGTPYKKPSMNATNPKALTRATRRLESFKKMYAKSVTALGYKVERRK